MVILKREFYYDVKKENLLFLNKFFMGFIVFYCIWFLYDMVYIEVCNFFYVN